MSWRYQPVWFDHDNGERTYLLCEVYFDDDGKLSKWTVEPAMPVYGVDDVQDLRGSLTHMLADAYRWKPVAHSDLKVGTTFERAISQDQMDRIADMLDAMVGASNEAVKALN